MKTNYEIVLLVYRDYKILPLIKKQICDCVITDSCKDLEQFIYTKLLVMDNFKLNELYYKKELRPYISQLIKNQRNYYASNYRKVIKSIYQTETIELNGIEVEDVSFHDFRIDILWNIIDNNKFGWSGLTQEEMRTSLSYEIYKLYLKDDISMEKLGKKFKMCRSTVNTLIKYAKQKIRQEYDIVISNYDSEFIMGDNNN